MMVILLLLVVYVAVAFEVDRRKRLCIGAGRRYGDKKRIHWQRKCVRVIDTLLFRT